MVLLDGLCIALDFFGEGDLLILKVFIWSFSLFEIFIRIFLHHPNIYSFVSSLSSLHQPFLRRVEEQNSKVSNRA